ncbi:MAG: hypothetical protein WED09_07310 [Homoserinimonas sp.]
MGDKKLVTIPVPVVAPLGQEVTRDEVRAAWETFVVQQQGGGLQSIEDRILMAILRAVYEGLPPTSNEPDTESTDGNR